MANVSLYEKLPTVGDLDRDPFDVHTIYASTLETKLARTILGVNGGIKADYLRFTGITPNDSYIVMRVILNPDVVTKNMKAEYEGDRILQDFASNTHVRSDVEEALKPFMFPDLTKMSIEDLQRIYKIGIAGENINEIQRFQKLTYIRDKGVFGIYLRPEAIIDYLLKDPETMKSREWEVIKVFGDTSATFGWHIMVDRGVNSAVVTENLDSIFKM